jgi:hypothetical protein
MTYNTGFGLYLLHLIHSQLGITGNCSAAADLLTLQFTVTHALGFSVFINRIQATDLSQSHCHFKSHMKSSFHAIILQLPTQFNSKIISRLAGVPELGSIRLLFSTIPFRLLSVFFCSPSAGTTKKT